VDPFFLLLIQRGSKFASSLESGSKYWIQNNLWVTHVAAGRAVLSALCRALQHRRQAFYTLGIGPPLGPEALYLEQQDFMVATGCGCHDVHNALKWSLAMHTVGDDITDSLHIAVASLRNSFEGIVSTLHAFLLRHLNFKAAGPSLRQERTAFWQALDVPVGILEAVVGVDPWWEDDYLYVSDHLSGEPSMLATISSVLLGLARWRPFNESRWCSMGPSCRALMVSVASVWTAS